MSEELIQKKLTKSGIKICEFEYYNIGATTLTQLKNYKIIPNKSYGKYSRRKPDGIIVDRRNKSKIIVIAIIEHKKPSEFKTEAQKKQAIEQCNDLCEVVGAKMGIITDGQTTFWINPEQKNKKNKYMDRTSKKERSFSFIRNEDKKDLSELFFVIEKNVRDFENLDDDTKNTLRYIYRILDCISKNNSELKSNEEVDPINLAKNVWQDIYINTGKDPTKCLYNVVELFIFKFLSDLKVLPRTKSFDYLINMIDEGDSPKEILNHYATACRHEIRNLFPAEEDGTTIINGTIFVDSNGDPVESQANLFKNSLKKYESFGSLKHIKKEFKTKLFETFLKQSQDKSKLGQFFTPRKVVKSIIEMSGVEKLRKGARFCDPFCGVGGFLLEPLHKTKLKNQFIPKNGEINPGITFLGFDKGLDSDEARTIILAKANMLIYLSEILEKNSSITTKFSKIFNKTFHLLTDSNLGTLKKIFKKEEDKFDLILTNPPYITSGVSSIKDEIRAEGLEEYYTKGGKGLEGLSLEWIIRSLKKGGKAFIVIPDSILNVTQNKNLREFLLSECYLDCLISLPTKTFFNTPKKTYILGITKKDKTSDLQDFPVFTYLVSNIGETLDVNRFETEGKSDLERAKDLFNSFSGSPKTFPVEEIGDLRCKIQSIEKFQPEDFWLVDKWWTKEEKINLGVIEEESLVTIDEFKETLKEFSNKLKDYEKLLEDI